MPRVSLYLRNNSDRRTNTVSGSWRFAILEMQVILCELVAKFLFAEVENEPVRVRFLNNLLPIVPSGERALPLRITRIL
ncbi:hypothetical protein B0H19DRAFT_658469 [Mycena capillaripes]|nr:hypothetical protein B0H19DRAFT_658469 [Mycena capillaripes]